MSVQRETRIMEAGNLRLEHVAALLEDICKCTKKIEATPLIDLDLPDLDDEFDGIQMRERRRIISDAVNGRYEEDTGRLGEKYMNGMHDKSPATLVTMAILLKLLFMESRTPRLAVCIILMGMFKRCLYYLRDPAQCFLSRSSIQKSVDMIYREHIKDLWADCNSHLRIYCIHEMVDLHLENPSIVTWEYLRDVFQYTIHDKRVRRRRRRHWTETLKELSRLCEHAPAKVATETANYFRASAIIFAESPWGTMMATKQSLKILAFCDPPLPREWFINILQKLLDREARPGHISAALGGLTEDFSQPHKFLRLLRSIWFPSARSLARFAKATRIWWHDRTFDNIAELLITKEVVPDRDHEEWYKLFTILEETCTTVKTAKVYEFLESSYELDHRGIVCVHCIRALARIHPERILYSERRYFKLLRSLIIDGLDKDNHPHIGKMYKSLKQMFEKWSPEVFEIGGSAILKMIEPEKIPLCLAGWIDGPTDYPVAAKFKKLMLALREVAGNNISQFGTRLRELSAECLNLGLSSFKEEIELSAVTKLLIQLYQVLAYHYPFITGGFQHFRLMLPQLYVDLVNHGTKFHRAFTSTKEEMRIQQQAENRWLRKASRNERRRMIRLRLSDDNANDSDDDANDSDDDANDSDDDANDSDDDDGSSDSLSAYQHEDGSNPETYRPFRERDSSPVPTKAERQKSRKKRILSPNALRKDVMEELYMAHENYMSPQERYWRQQVIRDLYYLDKTTFICGPVSISEIFHYIDWSNDPQPNPLNFSSELILN